MNWLNLFLNQRDTENEDTSTETQGSSPKKLSYEDILGIPLKLYLSKDNVSGQSDFDDIVNEVKFQVDNDFFRIGKKIAFIDGKFKKALMGNIYNICLVGDEKGALQVKYHLRDENGVWDNSTKEYPEKDFEKSKYSKNLFFIEE